MAQFMGMAGLLTGLSLGFLARDQFVFNMPEKMDAMNQDYISLTADLNEKIITNERDLQKLKVREQQLQNRYVLIKEKILTEGGGEEAEKKYFTKPRKPTFEAQQVPPKNDG